MISVLSAYLMEIQLSLLNLNIVRLNFIGQLLALVQIRLVRFAFQHTAFNLPCIWYGSSLPLFKVAPDFFEYFKALHPVLKSDQTLWCVSAWNDNGRNGYVDPAKSELLYRTDFFPGLGWMLLKEIWIELEPKWPASFWDDWMRHPNQRKGRSCIRPEISRTLTFGRKGVSLGQFYDKYLRFIKLNTEFVPFTSRDLSYLEQGKYDQAFEKEVYSAPLVTAVELKNGKLYGPGPFRLQYSNAQSFKTLARDLGLMDDLKSGVPRAGYRGVVSFFSQGKRIYIAPPVGWTNYDPSWSWGSLCILGGICVVSIKELYCKHWSTVICHGANVFSIHAQNNYLLFAVYLKMFTLQNIPETLQNKQRLKMMWDQRSCCRVIDFHISGQC